MANTRTTRKPRPAKAKKFDPDNVQPIKIKSRPDVEIETVHLFSIDDEEFHIPKKVKFNVTLKALKIFEEESEVAANNFMLVELLGQEGYDALVNFEDLEEEQFNQICAIARDIVLGPDEGKAR